MPLFLMAKIMNKNGEITAKLRRIFLFFSMIPGGNMAIYSKVPVNRDFESCERLGRLFASLR